jgi:hypothetical protein
MPRTPQARRTVKAIFLKQRINGADLHIREPYNIVVLDWSDGQPPKSYVEPAGMLLRNPSPDDAAAGADARTQAEIYDEVLFFDAPPFPKSRLLSFGY